MYITQVPQLQSSNSPGQVKTEPGDVGSSAHWADFGSISPLCLGGGVSSSEQSNGYTHSVLTDTGEAGHLGS